MKISGEEVKYIQISNHIKSLINNRIINDGEKLPSIRALAKLLGVNNITIVNCYKKLQSDGYAYQKIGSGTYAKRREVAHSFKSEYIKIMKEVINQKTNKVIDFTGETSKEVFFPIEEFKHIINKVLNRDGAAALTTLESLGYLELRKTINDVFWNSNEDINDIMIVSGAQQGIDIAAKSIVNINDNVIVESPTYGGALSVFKWRRANIFEVPIGVNGLNLKLLEEIVRKNKVKCFYTMSYFHNPTGYSYCYDDKLKILQLAEKYDFYIIEDDYLSELIFDKDMVHEPFRKLDTNDRVIYIKSFSKIFLPGIRLGYILYPKIFRENMQSSKINTDIATSTLMQRSLQLYISDGYFREHISKIRDIYIKRYNLIKEQLNDKLGKYIEYEDAKGGYNFYLNIKDNQIKSTDLFYKLIKKNVFITPGAVFYNNKEEGLNSFRIGFSQVSEEDIINGVQVIKEVMENWHI